MGRIQDLLQKQDQLLTQIAQGYGNSLTDYISTTIFPEIGVATERVRVPQFGKENLRIQTTERALKAASNAIEPEGITLTDFTLDEHDLSFPIDYRETAAAKYAALDLQRYAAQNTANALYLRREKIAADLAQNAALYSSNNKLTLSGNDKWSSTDVASDPIDDIFTAREAVRASSGRYPNTLVLGPSTYKALQNHSKIIERIKYSQTAVATPQLLSLLFDIDTVVVGKAVSVDSTGAFNDVWLDNAVLAYVPQNSREQRSQYVPSYGYTFTMNGFPSTDTFEGANTGGKVMYVRSTIITKPILLAAQCGFLISDCV